MNVMFTTEERVPERDAERAGVSSYAFGVLLLVALVATPVTLRLLAYVPIL
jgi:hypothetical protein